MNSKKQYLLCMLGGMMLAGMTACSGDNDTAENSDDGVKVRRITITQTEEAAEARQMATRATLTEGDGLLTASWTKGDGLTYCNLSRTQYNVQTGTNEPVFGNLTAASTAVTTQFTGDVSCSIGDYLAVVYPATTFVNNDKYTISLAGQDGTLTKLATSYHYVYGKAYVKSVTDKTANATIGKMKSLLTVCKFSFVNKDDGAAIPIKSLTISYGGTGEDAGTYPQSATVKIIDETNGILEQENVHATGVTGSEALTISASGQTEVYVALLRTTNSRTYNFTVTNSSGTYTGTAKATLTEGEYVEATGLRLTKQ
ncbi:MAG: hypothetical protein IJP74_07395 [Prevotella sp.]|nr:hypothetical protein [Prevotella sp.]